MIKLGLIDQLTKERGGETRLAGAILEGIQT